MPAGRPTNHDKKIATLINQLRRALVAREQARIEGQVALHVDALVKGLQDGQAAPAPTVPSLAEPAAVPAARSKKGNRKPRSAASRKAQSLKMKKVWAAKRVKAAPVKAKKGGNPSAGRARQIAAMKKYHAAKRAAKARVAAAKSETTAT